MEGSAKANLVYCHSKLLKLDPKHVILLVGDVYLIQGNANHYITEPMKLDSKTLVKLYGRTFGIRICANQHSIYFQAEDVIKDQVKLQPLEVEDLSLLNNNDLENDSSESDSESVDEDDDSSNEFDAAEEFDVLDFNALMEFLVVRDAAIHALSDED